MPFYAMIYVAKEKYKQGFNFNEGSFTRQL